MNSEQQAIFGGSTYLIRCDRSGLHKIGRTHDWARRSRELGVGAGTTKVLVVEVENSALTERMLHRKFQSKRLPQSEWFHLDQADLEDVTRVLRLANDEFTSKKENPDFQLAILEDSQRRAPSSEWEIWAWKIHQHKLAHCPNYAAEERRQARAAEKLEKEQQQRRLAATQARQTEELAKKEGEAKEAKRFNKLFGRMFWPPAAALWGFLFVTSVPQAGPFAAFFLAGFLSFLPLVALGTVAGLVALFATGGHRTRAAEQLKASKAKQLDRSLPTKPSLAPRAMRTGK